MNIPRLIKISIGTVIVVALIAAIFVLSSKFGVRDYVPSTTVTIYVSAPLSLQSSTEVIHSIKLALDEVDYEVNRKRIKLEILDNGDIDGRVITELERANALKAAKDPSTVAYIGPLSSDAAKVSMPILNEARVLQISPLNTWPGLTKTGFIPGEPGIFYPSGMKHYARVSTTDDLQGPAGAEWASQLGFSTVFVVDDGESYGSGISKLFIAEADKIGLAVVGSGSTAHDEIRELAQRIIESQAQLVYYGGSTFGGGPELLKALRAAGSAVSLLSSDGVFGQDFIERAGKENVEGVYISTAGAPPEVLDTDAARAFVTHYQNVYKTIPQVHAALAYETIQVILAAMSRSGSIDRETLLSEVRNTRNYSGIFGNWSFDRNGDTSADVLSGYRITNGNFVFMQLLEVR